VASTDLKQRLALDPRQAGKPGTTMRQLFGGKPNPDLLFSQMIGDSYNTSTAPARAPGRLSARTSR
jgi:conjugal transfer mating pair stabilization protein TraG